jgi:hypothetical protein
MKRTTGIVLGSVGAVAIAALVATVWAVTQPVSAEATAQRYLDALADGDAAQAVALLDDASALADPTTTLAAAEALIVDPRVTSADESEDPVRVRVEYMLAGARTDATLTLVRAEDEWLLAADALGTVAVTPTLGDAVALGGLTVAPAKPVTLLPAAYEIRAAPGDLLTGASTVAVAPGAQAEVALDVTLSPDATTVAQAQLDVYADACAQSADAVPESCGIRIPWAADLKTLDRLEMWVERHPILSIADTAASFDAVDGQLVATAYGTTRDGEEASFTYRTDGWRLQGGVTFDGAEMVLSVY